jgi:hypothetical protein
LNSSFNGSTSELLLLLLLLLQLMLPPGSNSLSRCPVTHALRAAMIIHGVTAFASCAVNQNTLLLLLLLLLLLPSLLLVLL